MSADRWMRAVGAALVVLAAAGCGELEAEPATYVGAVTGTDAKIGAVIDGTKIMFYVCGGESSFDTVTRWFAGEATEGGEIELARDGWSVRGDLLAGEGELTSPEGKALPWSLRPARPGTLEGLYHVEDSGCRTGAVVTQDGPDAPPSVQGTWCDKGGKYAQVTPILPVEERTRGIQVRVSLAKYAKDLFVVPFQLP